MNSEKTDTAVSGMDCAVKVDEDKTQESTSDDIKDVKKDVDRECEESVPKENECKKVDECILDDDEKNDKTDVHGNNLKGKKDEVDEKEEEDKEDDQEQKFNEKKDVKSNQEKQIKKDDSKVAVGSTGYRVKKDPAENEDISPETVGDKHENKESSKQLDNNKNKGNAENVGKESHDIVMEDDAKEEGSGNLKKVKDRSVDSQEKQDKDSNDFIMEEKSDNDASETDMVSATTSGLIEEMGDNDNGNGDNKMEGKAKNKDSLEDNKEAPEENKTKTKAELDVNEAKDIDMEDNVTNENKDDPEDELESDEDGSDEEEGEDCESGDDNDDEEDEESEDEESEDEESEDEEEGASETISDSGEEGDDSCPICLGRFRNQDIGTPETCDHNFCLECLQEWSKNVNTCPVDRQVYRLILAKKAREDHVYSRIPIDDTNKQAEEEEEEDETLCEVCGRSDREDRLLLCDGCDLGYHCECLTPPLSDVPVHEWFCPDCALREVADNEDSFEKVMEDATHNQHTERVSRYQRRIARTRISERVRARVQRNRAERHGLWTSSEEEEDEGEEDGEEEMEDEEATEISADAGETSGTTDLTQPSTSTTSPKARIVAKKKSPTKKRKTTTKRKGKVKRKTTTKKRKSTKGTKKGSRRKTKRKTKKTKKKISKRVRRAIDLKKFTTSASVKGRIANTLGLSKPPVGRTIPLQKKGEKLFEDKRKDESLSITGHKDDLIGFEDEVSSLNLQPTVGATCSSTARVSRYSKSALMSHRPVGLLPALKRKINDAPPAPKPAPIPSKPALGVHRGAPFDILGSIMQDQGKLHLHSKDVTINRDGSLTTNKPVKLALAAQPTERMGRITLSMPVGSVDKEETGEQKKTDAKQRPEVSSVQENLKPAEVTKKLDTSQVQSTSKTDKKDITKKQQKSSSPTTKDTSCTGMVKSKEYATNEQKVKKPPTFGQDVRIVMQDDNKTKKGSTKNSRKQERYINEKDDPYTDSETEFDSKIMSAWKSNKKSSTSKNGNSDEGKPSKLENKEGDNKNDKSKGYDSRLEESDVSMTGMEVLDEVGEYSDVNEQDFDKNGVGPDMNEEDCDSPCGSPCADLVDESSAESVDGSPCAELNYESSLDSAEGSPCAELNLESSGQSEEGSPCADLNYESSLNSVEGSPCAELNYESSLNSNEGSPCAELNYNDGSQGEEDRVKTAEKPRLPTSRAQPEPEPVSSILFDARQVIREIMKEKEMAEKEKDRSDREIERSVRDQDREEKDFSDKEKRRDSQKERVPTRISIGEMLDREKKSKRIYRKHRDRSESDSDSSEDSGEEGEVRSRDGKEKRKRHRKRHSSNEERRKDSRRPRSKSPHKRRKSYRSGEYSKSVLSRMDMLDSKKLRYEDKLGRHRHHSDRKYSDERIVEKSYSRHDDRSHSERDYSRRKRRHKSRSVSRSRSRSKSTSKHHRRHVEIVTKDHRRSRSRDKHHRSKRKRVDRASSEEREHTPFWDPAVEKSPMQDYEFERSPLREYERERSPIRERERSRSLIRDRSRDHLREEEEIEVHRSSHKSKKRRKDKAKDKERREEYVAVDEREQRDYREEREPRQEREERDDRDHRQVSPSLNSLLDEERDKENQVEETSRRKKKNQEDDATKKQTSKKGSTKKSKGKKKKKRKGPPVPPGMTFKSVEDDSVLVGEFEPVEIEIVDDEDDEDVPLGPELPPAATEAPATAPTDPKPVEPSLPSSPPQSPPQSPPSPPSNEEIDIFANLSDGISDYDPAHPTEDEFKLVKSPEISLSLSPTKSVASSSKSPGPKSPIHKSPLYKSPVLKSPAARPPSPKHVLDPRIHAHERTDMFDFNSPSLSMSPATSPYELTIANLKSPVKSPAINTPTSVVKTPTKSTPEPEAPIIPAVEKSPIAIVKPSEPVVQPIPPPIAPSSSIISSLITNQPTPVGQVFPTVQNPDLSLPFRTGMPPVNPRHSVSSIGIGSSVHSSGIGKSSSNDIVNGSRYESKRPSSSTSLISSLPFPPLSQNSSSLMPPPVTTGSKPRFSQLAEINRLLNTQARLAGIRPDPKTGGVFKIPEPPNSKSDKSETTEVVDMDIDLDSDVSSPSDGECELQLPPSPRTKKHHDINVFDDMPSSAMDLVKKQKAAKMKQNLDPRNVSLQYVQKLHLQERVVEEVKLAIKPFYSSKKITKEEYKEILRKAVPKICHSKAKDVNPMKIKLLVEGYVNKFQMKRRKKEEKLLNKRMLTAR